MAETQLPRLDRLESDFEAANIRVGEATWTVYSGEGEADLEAAQRQLTSLLTHDTTRSLIEGLEMEMQKSPDLLLSRRLALWRNCLTSACVDDFAEISGLKLQLQKRIAAFSFELAGRTTQRSELQRILRLEPDRQRRHQAWAAMASLAQANESDLRRLIALRNSKARQLGYRDYVDLVLKLQEIDESWLNRILGILVKEARPAYSRLISRLADSIGVDQLAPWDVLYALRKGFQLLDEYFPADKALPRLNVTAKALGFPVESLPIRTVVRDIPFGGYNVAVHIPTDTRFLVNPSEGHAFYSTTFHEYGHSLQAVYTATAWPILKEYEWVIGAHTAAYSEGLAEIMGDFTRRSDWLRHFGEVPDKDTQRYAAFMRPAQALIRLFELLANFKIEMAAYSAIDSMAAEERRIYGDVRMMQWEGDEPSLWAANTWYTSYPVYWQNYILASLIAAQAHEAMDAQFGTDAASNPQVAEYLQKNFYVSGNAVPWHERIRRGTGKLLEPQPFLSKIRTDMFE